MSFGGQIKTQNKLQTTICTTYYRRCYQISHKKVFFVAVRTEESYFGKKVTPPSMQGWKKEISQNQNILTYCRYFVKGQQRAYEIEVQIFILCCSSLAGLTNQAKYILASSYSVHPVYFCPAWVKQKNKSWIAEGRLLRE